MHHVADEAYFAYRERRLHDRYGKDDEDRGFDGIQPPAPTRPIGGLAVLVGDPGHEEEKPLDIIQLAETALTEEGDAPPGEQSVEKNEPAG